MIGAVPVDVWLLDVVGDHPQPVDLAVLDEHERARAARFRRASDAALYVAAHAGLRRVLATYLDTNPEQVELARAPCPLCGGDHGRPHAAGASVEFSMSHTPGVAAYAVCGSRVGIDVERRLRGDGADLRAALHPAEVESLTRLDRRAAAEATLRCWVRKEAYLKGIGTGLGIDPATIQAGWADGQAPPGWTWFDLPLGSAHVGSIAVEVAAPVVLGLRRLSASTGPT